ncbi:hypothetical protein, partial [Streptomyces fradiae]|uniref:hypothetical protein n=1 Tax=Streptomyces fradiae TaxID=1906 RepID=UPI001C404960
GCSRQRGMDVRCASPADRGSVVRSLRVRQGGWRIVRPTAGWCGGGDGGRILVVLYAYAVLERGLFGGDGQFAPR